MSIPRILLVPHASPHYTRQAMLSAVETIPPEYYSRAIVVSTFHNIKHEYSYTWMLEGFKETHLYEILSEAKVFYAKSTNSLIIHNMIYASLIGDSRCLIVFNSDLTHYGAEYGVDLSEKGGNPSAIVASQQYKTKWELPLLEALENSTPLPGSGNVHHLRILPSEETLPELKYPPCGMNVLNILSLITTKLNYKGTLLSYYDSMLVEPNADSFVSYLAMGFSPRPWNSDFPLTFKSRYPELNNLSNPVFLSLKYNNTSYACVGDLTNEKINEKIKYLWKKALFLDLESARLGELPDFITHKDLFVEVTILNYRDKVISKKHFSTEIPKITPRNKEGQYYGVRCDFGSISSIFIPSVWRDNPEWTIYNILEHLSMKAELDATDWKKALYIELFTEYGVFT